MILAQGAAQVALGLVPGLAIAAAAAAMLSAVLLGVSARCPARAAPACGRRLGGYFVSWRWPVPSAFMTQTSHRPVRSLWNAIRFPSGNQTGVSSSQGVECGASFTGAPPSTSTVQMCAVVFVESTEDRAPL